MEHRELVVDTVAAYTAGAGADTVLHLTKGRELIIRKDDPRLDVDNRTIAFQKERHLPVYIEFDPESHAVTQLLMCMRRQIEAVRMQPSGDVKVQIFMSPSSYKLTPTRPHFAALLAVLQKAAGTGREILVAIDPTPQEIVFAQDAAAS